MASQILSEHGLLKLYDTARQRLDRDEAVAQVAGLADIDPVRVESALAAREAAHSAAMGEG